MGIFSPLRIRTYKRLFSAQVIALAGTGLTTVALALLAYDLAGGNAGQVLGIALALKMIAYVVIAPLFGAVAQKLPRRSLLVTLDILRACVVAVLPFVTEVWQIYTLVFVLNVFSAGFTPVFQATIPDIVTDQAEYTKALSLSRLAYDLENLLSPMLAAALITIMTFDVLFLMNGFAFVLSAAFVLSVTLPARTDDSLGEPFWTRVTKGARIYLKTPRLRGLLALSMAVSSAGAMQIVNTVVYVRSHLGLAEEWVALAFAAAGGGSMAVALTLPGILSRVQPRSCMLFGGFVLSLSVLAGATMPGIPLLILLWFLMGAGMSMILTPAGRLLTQSSREKDRPALFAAQFSLSHACWLVTYPLAGWLGVQVGLMGAFMVLGSIALLSVVTAALLWPRQDPDYLEHTHHAVTHGHYHYHDEHHQHEHEGWEGPEPHHHTHRHSHKIHEHDFVIDDHHIYWPK
ncbi:MAG TPA: MFS transporter [Marinobacter antarcticus]|uniref:MFS transporter n=2 Tax=root TaxID=1 RepID=A0A831R574_9GAMM|nr:MFS transporter [Marinobacter antarcticus]HEA53157.1 MFS transporter [Marinobacter antarcticus]